MYQVGGAPPVDTKAPPTPAELQRIAKCMEHPEFRELMVDYLKSFNDPETRKEEEEYFRQLEQETRDGGSKLQIMLPTPEFCVRCRNEAREKVFINICSSDKVEVFSEQDTGDPRGAQWNVPISIGKERYVEDKKGVSVETWDAVFHPKTVKLANDSTKFQIFLVEICVEHINEGYKRTLVPEFKRLSNVKSKGRPPAQTIRVDKVGPNDNSIEIPGLDPKVLQAINISPAASATKATTTTTATTKTSSSTTTTSATPATVAATKAVVRQPKFEIVHRGEIALGDCWNSRESLKRQIPSQLLVRIELPDVSSASQVEVNITDTMVELSSSVHHYELNLALPFPVDSNRAEAKFDRSKRKLILTLNVVPPVNPKIQELQEDYKVRHRSLAQAAAAELESEGRDQLLLEEDAARAKLTESEREGQALSASLQQQRLAQAERAERLRQASAAAAAAEEARKRQQTEQKLHAALQQAAAAAQRPSAGAAAAEAAKQEQVGEEDDEGKGVEWKTSTPPPPPPAKTSSGSGSGTKRSAEEELPLGNPFIFAID